jgi:aspartate aminotransferase-like enzyme
MARVGADLTELTVELGRPLDLERLAAEARRIRPKAITLVHNETSTGTTYPADAVGRIARDVDALFLLDTVSSLAGIDVRTDEWGVDLCMTGSQKCLAAPLGLALVAVSPRAWDAMERRRRKATSYAYDLLRWKDLWMPESRGGHVRPGAPRRQPVSIPTHLTAAMIAAGALRAGLHAMSLEMFPDPSVWSSTVSCVRTPRTVDPEAVVSRMREDHGILVGTGLAELRTTTLRIGTMGMTASPQYVLPTLGALELALRDLGFKAETGAGVAAAQRVFGDAS